MKQIIPIIAVIFVAGCANPQQMTANTSGAAFVAARNAPIDRDIRNVALVEPDLQFPARIGLAKVDNRRVLPLTTVETDTLAKIQIDPTQVGSFHPVIVFGSALEGRDGTHDARLHAAEQHLDYVLVYKLRQESRGFQAKGRIDVALVDVRNGYVYGRTFAEAGLAGLGHTRDGWRKFSPSDAGAAKLIKEAMPNVADMLNTLISAS